jgi:hypothetical protein
MYNLTFLVAAPFVIIAVLAFILSLLKLGGDKSSARPMMIASFVILLLGIAAGAGVFLFL